MSHIRWIVFLAMVLLTKLIIFVIAANKTSVETTGFPPKRLPLPFSTKSVTYFCQSCTCGLSNGSNRIVGGKNANVERYPWIAMLRFDDSFYCGGSLINNKYVLTAAHCAKNFLVHQISVRLLLSKLNDTKSTGIERSGVVIGWGATTEKGQLSSVLQELSVPIISNKHCRRLETNVTSNMLCAGDLRGGQDSCSGDSGGPLLVADGSKFVQVGIVSWGTGCARFNRPGVYTRVSNYISWIQRNTVGSCYC